MKYININGWFVAVMMALTSLSLVGCGDEDEEDMNEWKATFVYLQRSDYLITNVKTFDLIHDVSGMGSDKVSMNFTVHTQKPAMQDVTVNLTAAIDIPELDGAASLSASTVTIKAGEQHSEEITMTVDIQALNAIKQEMNGSFTVVIKDIVTKDRNTIISAKQSLLSATIHKSSYSPVTSVKPAGWQAADRSDWVATASHIYAKPNQPAYAIDGKLNTSWFAYGENSVNPCWLNVKLVTPIDMIGFSIIRENAFGGYDVEQAKIQLKKQGDSDWTSLDNVTYTFKPFISTAPQYATLDEPIRNVIEVRLLIINPKDFVGVGEFDLYEKK